jgi:hypothetical protein
MSLKAPIGLFSFQEPAFPLVSARKRKALRIQVPSSFDWTEQAVVTRMLLAILEFKRFVIWIRYQFAYVNAPYNELIKFHNDPFELASMQATGSLKASTCSVHHVRLIERSVWPSFENTLIGPCACIPNKPKLMLNSFIWCQLPEMRWFTAYGTQT